MIVPDAELRRSLPPRRPAWRSYSGERWLGWLLLALAAGALAWFAWVYTQIRYYAYLDQAQPADAIVVFGAAEYDGRPSPVLRARLEHALTLYRRGLAPLVITLGGGGDPQYSEGGVGESFLMAHGVPEKELIAETQSSDTEESAKRLAAIARANDIHRILAVSDGTHLFRIHALCGSYGLTVYTSPRKPGKPISQWDRIKRMAHEMLSYTGWRLHLH